MNPHLLYAQAIHGRFTGRGIGIIDTLHLVEVARAIEVLEGSPSLSAEERAGVKGWFTEYLRWLTTHKHGLDERETTNNHATCWTLQVAMYARLVGDEAKLEYCRQRFKAVHVARQMAADGSFPREIGRTKPYGYSLFVLDAMAGVAQVLSTPRDDLWAFTLPDGRGMRRAMEFLVPYIRDKKGWPHPKDVMYDEHWPMRHPSLLFAARAYDEPGYLELWKGLPADSEVEEVVRNFFLRQPVLWVKSVPR